MTLEKIKLDVLSHLQYERDERIPELIEMYGGDEQYVIDEIWGPLETCLDGKLDSDLVDMINEIMDAPTFESEFNEYKEYMDANVIFYSEDELTPAGLKKQMDELRTTFLPILSKIDLSKE